MNNNNGTPRNLGTGGCIEIRWTRLPNYRNRSYNEEQKRLQTRIYGTQGTHFLTNLVSNNVIYGFIIPNEDLFDPWFFTATDPNDPVYLLSFPEGVNIYADSINQKCVVVA